MTYFSPVRLHKVKLSSDRPSHAPLGLLGGAELSLMDVIFKNLLPVTLGNAIAGGIIVAAGYSYAFGKLGGN